MAYDKELLRDVISDLQQLRNGEGFTPTPDIDMVWVLSAPGTYYEESNDGAYSGKSFDRINIDAGAEVVRTVTASRLGKAAQAVTRADIEERGPIFFYNGEDEGTEKVMYHQNDALRRAMREGDLLIPESKVAIGRISTLGTLAQIVEGAKDVCEQLDGIAEPKIAVVSLFAHSARVGRYLEKYRDSYPTGARFVSVPVAEGDNGFAAAMREAKRIMLYAAKGHLARTSVFAKGTTSSSAV